MQFHIQYVAVYVSMGEGTVVLMCKRKKQLLLQLKRLRLKPA